MLDEGVSVRPITGRPTVRTTGPVRALAAAALALTTACGTSSSPDVATPPDPSPRMTQQQDPVLLGAPEPGECREGTWAQLNVADAARDVVPCTGPHTTVVAAVLELPAGVRPTDSQELVDVAERECPAPARELLGGDREQQRLSVFAVGSFRPTPAQARQGARWLSCEVAALVVGAEIALELPTTPPPYITAEGAPEEYRRCYRLRNDTEPVRCTDPRSVVKLTHTLDGAADSGTLSPTQRCQRAFPRAEVVGVLTGFYDSLEPDVEWFGCLSYDLEALTEQG